MDITSLYNVTSDAVKNVTSSSNIAKAAASSNSEDMFSTIFNSAVSNLSSTNSYISDAENEEIKLAMGETESTHDLTIALQKASTALQYTVAVRDKFMEAYKEIMQMQI
jgi:flagellar hook-basal body complex protein FliE